ncbi:phosphate acyltransferase PlsX [Leisingera sp. S232]|uniref:phosphate acyltransferase PlsX n=1 Tax=Leisingera sp. S232 TaxID=3415132 RepID=UPI00086C37CF|nr:phosphate acyltransferase [Rhodobacteraceae bacterium (ex Bugula neritina AB1)]
MTGKPDHIQAEAGRITISVDAMGGDAGPAVVVAGIAMSAARNPDISFILHGPADQLAPLVAKKHALQGRVEIRDVHDVVTMEDKPSQVMRNGKGTSMWSALDAVKNGEAAGAVSCGNTGALMALSMLRLRKLPGVNRPAIAILWPSLNPQGFNVMLDVGADVKADAEDLLQYALMGTSYVRNSMDISQPRVGLLNVGTEEHKGRTELKEAFALISENAEKSGFEFVGFVEGSDIPGDIADVIVTDGFTGNVAIKTGEGTASLMRTALKEAFEYSFLSKIAALLAMTSLKRLSKRMDPRRVNGGVFLGLNGTVVKSHGGADAMGVSAAVKLAFRLAEHGFAEKLAARVASVGAHTQDNTASRDLRAATEKD